MKKQYRNYMREQKNKLRKRLDGRDSSLQKLIDSKIKYEENYGKYPELIKLGENDRLGCHSPRFIEDESMRRSYEYGFFERGSRILAGKFEKKIFTEEEQRNFGIRDFNNGVKDDKLFNLINYQNYMNGRIYQMGRNIYNYISENNIEIDEYIGLMSVIYPNISSPEFKMGYYVQEKEMENNKKRR